MTQCRIPACPCLLVEGEDARGPYLISTLTRRKQAGAGLSPGKSAIFETSRVVSLSSTISKIGSSSEIVVQVRRSVLYSKKYARLVPVNGRFSKVAVQLPVSTSRAYWNAGLS